jgi:hypothetical protein
LNFVSNDKSVYSNDHSFGAVSNFDAEWIHHWRSKFSQSNCIPFLYSKQCSLVTMVQALINPLVTGTSQVVSTLYVTTKVYNSNLHSFCFVSNLDAESIRHWRSKFSQSNCIFFFYRVTCSTILKALINPSVTGTSPIVGTL